MKKHGMFLAAASALLLSACQSNKCTPSETNVCIDNKEAADIMQEILDGMVFIPAGEFYMGLVQGPEDEMPERKIYMDDYFIYQSEHTWKQIDAFYRLSGYGYTDGAWQWEPESGVDLGAEQPAFAVYYYDAHNFCQWIGDLTGLDAGLQTEAQYEKAAKNGNRSHVWATADNQFIEGRDYPTMEQRTVTSRSGHGESVLLYIPVTSQPPSPNGLYGLHTNGEEWTADLWRSKFLELAADRNPTFPVPYETRLAGRQINNDKELKAGERFGVAVRGGGPAWDRYNIQNSYIQQRIARDGRGTNSLRCTINASQLPTINQP
ncbi:SUMF1/EgtB/PvdO family nonheme iron enzyme [Salinibius halmophilus]|uniref:SUMF1/EgtB/PvdO family nonheme iron enzyme n=1 Tax=Salinibius halmophilus TaxID=1853216 RepID=UPI000E675F50|nr:SUMF1/EgtB/PvdO family nonheme iron enzyme [Salinibius halmophilus]